METKNILLIVIIAFVIIIGAALLYTNQNSVTNATPVNNTTNVTGNNTLNTTGIDSTINASLNNSVGRNSASSSSSSGSSSGSGSQSDSEPAYGSDEYVKKWDESQANGGDWAYTHDQPVKTGDDGNRYARVYHEDKGESSWESMEPPAEEI